MTTIIRRTGKHGQLSFRAQLRRQGAPPTERHTSFIWPVSLWRHITSPHVVGPFAKATSTCERFRHRMHEAWVPHIPVTE